MKNKALSRTYDFIVVGGGLAGLSCAYWLKKHHSKATILILNDSKIIQSTSSSKIPDLTVGSLAYMYDLYQTHGIEMVVDLFKEFDKNIDLMNKELNVIDRNPYLNVFSGGTVNHFDSDSVKDNGSFESFIDQLKKSHVKLEKVESENLKLGVKFSHDGNYESDGMMKTLYKKLTTQIDIVENESCKLLSKLMDDIRVKTVIGSEYLGKNVILTAGASLGKFIPEVKEKIKVKKSFVMRVESPKNHLDLFNYSSASDNDYFVKLKDGYFFAHHDDFRAEDDAQIDERRTILNFEKFKAKNFPTGEFSEINEASITYSTNGVPLMGRSLRNNSLYYLGGFSGQSKLSAFKVAKELVEMIKL